MPRTRKGGSTMKQMAYARGLLGATGTDKKRIALQAGYSPYVANSISSHIENQPGFHNAMTKLAYESNNLALAALHEFKSRGFENFTNKELNGALNAIGSAWARFNNAGVKERESKDDKNKLRTVILQQVENQTITSSPPSESPSLIVAQSVGDDEEF